ncbi:MAG: HD domain-containing protein [Desulfobacterales bacterium]
MDKQLVRDYRNRFFSYVRTFTFDDPVIQRNIDLKLRHTLRVCREVVAIGAELGLKERDLSLSETTALFHDIGRFEQYARYRTFSDSRSVNHARLGADILLDQGILDGLEEKDLILRIVSCHNCAVLPSHEDENFLFFSRLLRDADKLDIWRVVTDYYQEKENGVRNGTIELDLPDTPGISKKIRDRLINGETILFHSMKNLNDFKLLQVGWVYDVNFSPTFKRIEERGILAKLRRSLPDSADVRLIFQAVDTWVENQLHMTPESNRGRR